MNWRTIILTLSMVCVLLGTAFLPRGSRSTSASSTSPLAPSSTVFSNPAQINLFGGRTGPVYPSTINVSGLTGTIVKVTAKLKTVKHTWPDDLGVLLVGPTGVKVRLMTDAGGYTDFQNGHGFPGADLIFDDGAPVPIQDNPDNYIDSGTFKPTFGTTTVAPGDVLHPADFGPPAPASPYALTLASFNGTDPNGAWKLYVDDDYPQNAETGNIEGGWSLVITTTPVSTPGGNGEMAAAFQSDTDAILAFRTM